MTVIGQIECDPFRVPHGVASVSPFRYPGGKAFLTNFIRQHLPAARAAHLIHYAEPYCGGAGAAIQLLAEGSVGRLHLNDLDPCIYSAWRAMLSENDRFVRRIETTPVSVETWKQYRAVVTDHVEGYSFEAGFAAFFLNRTSMGGLIVGSGPIGGYGQAGTWKVDARFYRETTLGRIRWLGSQVKRIRLYNMQGAEFVRRMSKRPYAARTLCFADPPYVDAGRRLYLDGMGEDGHDTLARCLRDQQVMPWLLTYDDHALVRELYRGLDINELNVRYSLRRVRQARELLVRPLAIAKVA